MSSTFSVDGTLYYITTINSTSISEMIVCQSCHQDFPILIDMQLFNFYYLYYEPIKLSRRIICVNDLEITWSQC